MRFVVYIMALAALIFMGVTIFQVIVKRITNKDLVRRKQYQEAVELCDRLQACLEEVKTICSNALIVNDNDLTAGMILGVIIHKNENV
jgi:hypothetical protein